MRSRTLLRNGVLYVPTRGFPTAMLIDPPRILWIGDELGADAQVDNADVVVDLGGRLVTTPFVDPYVPVGTLAEVLGAVDLSVARSMQEALDMLAAAANSSPTVVVGRDYDESRWPELRIPTPEELARAVGDRPALMMRRGRSSGVGTPALRVVAEPRGLEPSTWGDVLTHDQVHDGGMAAVALRPDIERHDLVREALRALAQHGVSCVHDHTPASQHVPRQSLPGDATDLPIVKTYLEHLCPPHEDPRLVVAEHGLAGLHVRVDGPAAMHRASMAEPYIDMPGHCGPDPLDENALADHLVATTLAGVQTSLVTEGDRAASVTSEALRTAVRTVGLERFRDAHHRILTHALGDLRVLGTLIDLGVSVTRVPQDAIRIGGRDGLLTRRLGRARSREQTVLASVLAEGLELSLASCAPLADLDPWQSIRAARWHPDEEERISVGSAFRAHTSAGWRITGDDRRGYLDTGLPADLVVWDVGGGVDLNQQDRLHTPGLPALEPGSPNPRAVLTVVAGRLIHASEGALP